MIKSLISYIKAHKSIFFFLGFLIIGGFYFISKTLVSNIHLVHFAFDDKIPFIPIFILPYIIWYPYVPGLMALVFFKDEKAFKKQAIIFFSGAVFCSLIFLVYPTYIDFRPDVSGKGILLWITRIIYKNDMPPVNAFPSLHCYEALSVHLTAFTVGPFKKKLPFRIASALLMATICASTVFVKQHSFVDIIGGCAVAVLFCIVGEFIFRGKKNGKNLERRKVLIK
ncbi:MAG: phosphatase PAP2 family protein [Clostridia bacterium]|nr:phosphatase PAP2 family protein [Clostridia bacterium]